MSNKKGNKQSSDNKRTKVKEEIIKEEQEQVQPQNKKTLKHKIIEVVLYLLSYTLTFLIVDNFFDSFVIAEPKILFSLIAVIIIYVLNKLVRPIIVTLTMPLMGITFGLFFFVINSIILKITDWIMFSKFDFNNIWILLLISVVVSVLKFIIEDVILKELIGKALEE